MAEEQTVSPSTAMDILIRPEYVQDWVIGSGLAQASCKINGQWFQVHIFPQTRQEIIDSFGQAD